MALEVVSEGMTAERRAVAGSVVKEDPEVVEVLLGASTAATAEVSTEGRAERVAASMAADGEGVVVMGGPADGRECKWWHRDGS